MHAVPSLFRQLRLIAKLDFMVSVSTCIMAPGGWNTLRSLCGWFFLLLHQDARTQAKSGIFLKKGRGEMHDSSLVQHVAPSNLCLWTGDSVGSGIYVWWPNFIITNIIIRTYAHSSTSSYTPMHCMRWSCVPATDSYIYYCISHLKYMHVCSMFWLLFSHSRKHKF